jgi:hypothetical protein
MVTVDAGHTMRLRFPFFGFARQFQTDLLVLARCGSHRRARVTERIVALDRLAGTALLGATGLLLVWVVATQSTLLDITSAVASSAYQATFGPSQAEAGRLDPKNLAAPLTAHDVRLLQSRLKQLGFDPGAIDGVAGKRTLDALNLYRATKSLERAPGIDRATIAGLLD